MDGSYVATNSNTKLGDLALFCIPLFSRTNASALSLDLFCNNVIILMYLVTRNSNKSPYYDKYVVTFLLSDFDLRKFR